MTACLSPEPLPHHHTHRFIKTQLHRNPIRNRKCSLSPHLSIPPVSSSRLPSTVSASQCAAISVHFHILIQTGVTEAMSNQCPTIAAEQLNSSTLCQIHFGAPPQEMEATCCPLSTAASSLPLYGRSILPHSFISFPSVILCPPHPSSQLCQLTAEQTFKD